MHIHVEGSGPEGQAASVELSAGEAACVLRPETIIAYSGDPRGREDRLLNLSGMYRKKKWIESRLTGPARFVLGVPSGWTLRPLILPEGSSLLFDIKHVLLYKEGMQLQSRMQRVKQALLTRDWVRMKFSGGGTLGLLSHGPLCELTLDPVKPVYVDIGSLIAYPEEAKLGLCVYGNTLASQRMNYHWEITGRGKVLLHPPGVGAGRGGMPMPGDSLLRRVLREVLPFGGIWIK